MNTVNNETPTSGLFAGLVHAWREFWYRPADPIVLGFIRVCTGLVLLYILLASGPFLSAFYGSHAWVDDEASDILRKEMPWIPPETGWEYDDAPAWFIRMDTNRDGVVVRKEWTRAMPEFDDIDTDRDGKLTKEEANRYGLNLVIRQEATRPLGQDRVWEHWGVYERYTSDVGQPFFSPYFHLKTRTELYIAHALSLLIAVLFTVGLGGRVTSVLAWVVALSYVHRISAAVFGMDTMLAILMLYLMIGPATAALSLDRLIHCRRLQSLGLPIPEPEPGVLANVTIRLLQVHFCVMYFVAGASKMQGAAWWNGTAIWQTLTNYEFAPAQFELFTTILRWLTYNRLVWEIVHLSGAWATLILEISLPFLIWSPRWRWLMIIGAVGLHTFIALTMGLTAFSMLMICIVFAFIPPEALHAALGRMNRMIGRLKPRAAEPRAMEQTANV